MAKIKLGVTPKHVPKTITFEMIDPATGKPTKGEIGMQYRYRDSEAYGRFVDELTADQPASEADPQAKFTMEAFLKGGVDAKVRYIMGAADGWDLEEEFTADNVRTLANQVPAAAISIIEGYRSACTEGRLGN